MATPARVALGVVLLLMAVQIGFDLPNITEDWVSRNGMTNWIAADAFDATDQSLPLFRQAPQRDLAPGYRLVISAARLVGQPVMLGKGLPWAVVIWTVLLLFALARRLAGPVAALAACVLFLHRPGLQQMLSLLPEVFAWPALAGLLLAMVKERPRQALGWIGFAGLFYAPVALVGTAAFLAWRLPSWDIAGARAASSDRHLWVLGGLVVALALLLRPASFTGEGEVAHPSYMESLGRADAALSEGFLPPLGVQLPMIDLPEHSVLDVWGRDLGGALLRPFAAWGRTLPGLERAEGWWLTGAPACLLILLLFAALALGRRAAPPRPVALVAAAGVGLYALASATWFLLFLPDRYSKFALPLVAIVTAGVVVGRLAERLPERGRLPAALAGTALFLTLYGTGIPGRDSTVDDYRDAQGLLEHLRTTDPDVVIAGPPHLMDAVELMAERRTALLCQEVLSLLHVVAGRHYEELRARQYALHYAWYSPDPTDLLSFAERYDVDLVVLDRRRYQRNHLSELEPLCRFVAEDAPVPVDASRAFGARAPTELLEYSDDVGYAVLSVERLQEWVERR